MSEASSPQVQAEVSPVGTALEPRPGDTAGMPPGSAAMVRAIAGRETKPAIVATNTTTPRGALAPERRRAGKTPRPSLACQYARSRSEKMVCADRRLARADRALKRAYDRAIASGVPPHVLDAEQADWLAIREDAARHSPRAVAAVYAQRTDELIAMADPPY